MGINYEQLTPVVEELREDLRKSIPLFEELKMLIFSRSEKGIYFVNKRLIKLATYLLSEISGIKFILDNLELEC